MRARRTPAIVAALAAGVALLAPAPAAASVHLVGLTSPVSRGRDATLLVRVSPARVVCSITVSYESGPSTARLQPVANLFPERGGARSGYRAKDRLENQLHDLVCARRIALGAARVEIAADWQALDRKVHAIESAS